MRIIKEEIILDKHFPFGFYSGNLSPGYNTDSTFHWHECLEITYIRKGHGKYLIEDRIYEMGPGDIIIINNIEPHKLEVCDEVMYSGIIFDPSLVCSDYSHSMDYDYLKPFFERGTDFKNKLNLPPVLQL